MATHKSAVKRHKQSIKRTLRNQTKRTRIKNLTKDVQSAIEAEDQDTAKKALDEAIPAIQKAASKGTIHKRTAARKISRLTRMVNTLQSVE
ncbi:MAG: 30S ribosomal protein S20 [bacterium]